MKAQILSRNQRQREALELFTQAERQGLFQDVSMFLMMHGELYFSVQDTIQSRSKWQQALKLCDTAFTAHPSVYLLGNKVFLYRRLYGAAATLKQMNGWMAMTLFDSEEYRHETQRLLTKLVQTGDEDLSPL